LCSLQQIYYIHNGSNNVVHMKQISYIHNVVYIINLLDCTQGCVYNINLSYYITWEHPANSYMRLATWDLAWDLTLESCLSIYKPLLVVASSYSRKVPSRRSSYIAPLMLLLYAPFHLMINSTVSATIPIQYNSTVHYLQQAFYVKTTK